MIVCFSDLHFPRKALVADYAGIKFRPLLQKTSQRAIGLKPMDGAYKRRNQVPTTAPHEWRMRTLVLCVIFLSDSQYTSELYQN